MFYIDYRGAQQSDDPTFSADGPSPRFVAFDAETGERIWDALLVETETGFVLNREISNAPNAINGYRVFGELDYPPGHKRFFLQKRLG